MKILIVLPTYNEEKVIRANVEKVIEFCRLNLPIEWQLIIADNASSDRTAAIGKILAAEYPEVNYFFVAQKGKGAAIAKSWQKFDADIYSFMDADLATDLSALPKLISAIIAGSDLAIGNRFDRNSRVERSVSRWIYSYGYSWAARILLGTKIADLPCGFKAINTKVKNEILPAVTDSQWFFDSEFVIRAEEAGYKIDQIPVTWHDLREGTDKSRVKALAVAKAYFIELIKLRKKLIKS